MKFCLECFQEFDSGVDKCPNDGSSLTDDKEGWSLVAGRVIQNRYRILQQIGKGGCGAVFSALDLSVGQIVAIKVLLKGYSGNREVIKRFVRETKTLAKLSHPNIIAFYESGKTAKGYLYYVMEYLEGESLNRLIYQGPVLLPVALPIMAQIADALIQAHEIGVIHRDLKPQNIFLSTEKQGGISVKVLDFGIAKLKKGVDSEESRLTQTGDIFGTPHYMSPEQSKGKLNIDHRSDIYSFGIIMYEMLCGIRPFWGETPLDVLLKQASEIPKPLPVQYPEIQLPKKLEDLVMQCLAKDPEQRPQTVKAVKAVLAEVMAEVMAGVEPESKETPTFVEGSTDMGGEDSRTMLENASTLSLTPVIKSEDYTKWIEAKEDTDKKPQKLGYETTLKGEPAPSPEFTAEVRRNAGAKPGPFQGSRYFIMGLLVVLVISGLSAYFIPQWLEMKGAYKEAKIGGGLSVSSELLKFSQFHFEEAHTQINQTDIADPEKDDTITISLESQPIGAKVILKGKELGQTPLTHRFEKKEGQRQVTFQKAGYHPLVKIIDPQKSPEKILVQLRPVFLTPPVAKKPKSNGSLIYTLELQ